MAPTLLQALNIMRESEGTEHVDPAVADVLDRELQSIWKKLRAQPDSYILTRDEYSLFNLYRHNYPNDDVATKAIQRFWDRYRGDGVKGP
ncbi:uncharacterized protein K452DRAFT_228332 [Aplosporella prunicola CBS 121167]|uniref:Uncharacterized protein n=1 Tax=Aplosporella prunicola CBS 121167 TaxID=1176127 RepID=A0A6A6BDB7_9PEZI|nr:uncharacterized protein K452DRAFT_228332 [Aplosporella prunicola CBS 121167]KAF2141588.1 hypothetical protein K452DRAFT_228332 [Aplosporella prunicola CBS 121167]